MPIEPDRQRAAAARLAGLLPPPSTVQARAERIVADFAPAMAAAMTAEIDQLRVALAGRESEERVLLDACRAVGAAVDRLEQARDTNAEIPARRALENAATRLRRAIRRKDVHATR